MDDLPLELKQRVCSYLTPKDLKSFRLTAKFYAAATDRYLIPRIFLSNHPDSFQEIQDITNHPELRHSVTTLVVETSCLPLFPRYEDWVRIFVNSNQVSAGKTDTRVERVLRRQENHEQWTKYQDLAMAQRNARQSMLDSIALAFQRCPKLRNFIVECSRQQNGFDVEGKQDRFYQDIHAKVTERARGQMRWWLGSMRFDIWDLLKPVHDVNRALNSLALLDTTIWSPQNWSLPSTTILHSLKHLRHFGYSSRFLPSIAACAPELESIGMLGTPNSWHIRSLQSLLGGLVLEHLRACSLNRVALVEADVVPFLLRHSKTLQDLRIKNEIYTSRVNWVSFAQSVRGQLPNLRRVEISSMRSRGQVWASPHGWTTIPTITAADLLQDHEYDLEMGPSEIADGLWKDYEQPFFP